MKSTTNLVKLITLIDQSCMPFFQMLVEIVIIGFYKTRK